MTRTLKIEDDKSGATKFKYTGNTGNRFSKPANMNGISVELGL